jgi:glycosyltransferase involved in cell wall biosynthesis
MDKITAVIITYNEESNIENCLKSLDGVADEIIVMDSFSKDKTEEICRKFNVRFYQHAWDGFSSQKNRAIAFSSNKHILSLDADECLSEELKKSILDIKNNWTDDAYTFNLITNYAGKWIKHCGWYPEKKLRIWDSQKGLWKGDIHERVDLDPSCKIRHIPGLLYHYTCTNFKEHMDTSYKYADIAAHEMINNKKLVLSFKILVSPVFKFFKIYFLKLGILDGFAGLIISRNAAYFTFMKYFLAIYYQNNGFFPEP